jgi:hypothetical protein
MMTPQERNEHRARLRTMQSYDECVAYMAQHREQMAAHAKERAAGRWVRRRAIPARRSSVEFAVPVRRSALHRLGSARGRSTAQRAAPRAPTCRSV